MAYSPMIGCPLKQTNEIDWIAPLKAYIRTTYGDDPDIYSEECSTLNRLRQDMRGAGTDSASGRDLLYRYYGQLELLDLRFPVDENHIKISFTWFDAFTHKPTSQYSLAYEKASVIFNISAVLSCHAANQNRSDDNGLKTAYHSFQASAGMFTYINENFLHAPSTDLSRETVKTLISITLAQGQEVFLEKQVADGKKPGLLAKLAAQAHFLYSQAVEGVQENFAKGVFDSSWSKVVQIKASHTASLSEYYQALADDDGSSHGSAIARLQIAEKTSKTAVSLAKGFPSSVSASSNLSSDTGPNLQSMTKRQLENVQEKLSALIKDNDFIYHQSVPAEASLTPVTKFPAAKAIPVTELYQGQDIQRIIGPDIFQKIVPMSVTESASMYDEEKAKLVRSEADKVETANGEMAASLDYLKLPASLNVLKGGMDDQQMTVDNDFRQWCEELAAHEPFSQAFDQLQRDKSGVLSSLEKSSKQLDMEESVCEKMRSKYGSDWTQQPSSRLTSTLRSDIRSYRETIGEASTSDAQLTATARQYESDFEEMRSAGESDEADVLYQQAMVKAGAGRGHGRGGNGGSFSPEGTLLDEDYGEGGPSVADQIAKVEELLKKLNLVKRERGQVLKDLKEKVHEDDISNVLILNKKSIANHENQLFQAELEKFRSHQNRLLSTVHKQSSLLKELTKTYGDLLQDKRVRADQQRYEAAQRSKSTVMSRYKRIFSAHEDLIQGLMRAQGFYSEMKENVDSLEKNVETFVNNRRAEGAQLLSQIEQAKSSSADSQANAERERLQQLMERMSMEPQSSSTPARNRPSSVLARESYGTTRSPPISPQYPPKNADPRFTIPPSRTDHPVSSHTPQPQASHSTNGYQYNNQQSHPLSPSGNHPFAQGAAVPLSAGYNPMAYPFQNTVSSPPPNQHHSQQQYFSPTAQTPQGGSFFPPQHQQPYQQGQQQQQQAPTPQQLSFQRPQSSQQKPYSQHSQPHPSYSQPSPQPFGMPAGYVPPPPPGPPPGPMSSYPSSAGTPYAAGPGGYANSGRSNQQQQQQYHQQQQQQTPQQQQQQQGGDPWVGLNAWK